MRSLLCTLVLSVASCAAPPPAPVVVLSPPSAQEAAPTASPATAPMKVAAHARCGREPEVLATHESLLGLALDRERVYWSDGAGRVMAVSKDGGEPTVLARTALAPQNLTVIGGDVIWIEYGAVLAVPGVGGTKQTLAGGNGITMGIAPAGSSVIVIGLDRDTVSVVPAAGGAKSDLFKGKTGIRIAADTGGAAFWRAVGRDAFDLTYVAVDGSAPLSLAPGQHFPGPIALDAESIYFDGGAGIRRVARGGGPEVSVTADTALDFALDDRTLYYATQGGDLKRVPAAGGVASRLASVAPHYAPRLAVDEACVYFAAKDRVMKVAKR